MDAYKFVPTRLLEDFSSGSVKVGSYHHYANIEGDRRDESEGTYTRKVDTGFLGPIDEHEANKLKQIGLGFAVGSSHILLHDVTFRYRSEHFLIFCMSLDPSAELYVKEEPQTIFQVNNIDLFAYRLSKSFVTFQPNFNIDIVHYSGKIVKNFEELNGNPMHFWKDEKYSNEKEIRIVFEFPPNIHVPDFQILHSRSATRLVRKI